MLQRVALSSARCYLSRHPIAIRRYAAQPAYATSVSTLSGGDLSDLSSAGAHMEVAVDGPVAGQSNAGTSTEKKKRATAKRIPQDPATVKESKPRKKRTVKKEEKEERVPAQPLKPIEESATYLNWLGTVSPEETSRDAVFAEVERIRPSQRPRTYHVPSYKSDYAILVKRLEDSFSRDQLHDFCSAHSLRMKEKNKLDLVESIIEQHWGWPSWEELQMEERVRTEVVQQDFPLNASEVFLVLGKDGSDVLRLSSQHRVRARVDLQKGKYGFYLHAEGTRESLGAFATHIEDTKRAITAEAFRLPVDRDIPPHLIQRISRLTSTFLEPVEEDPFTIRMYATNARSIESAKRLATQAVTDDEYAAQTTLLSYLPPKIEPKTLVPLNILPPSYSLYPFFSPRSLPWNMPTSAFRVRRVGEWLGHDASEDIRDTGGFAGGKAAITTSQQVVVDNLKDAILDGFIEEHDRPIQIHALPGHLLYTNPNQAQVSLSPPLTGAKAMANIMKWANEVNAKPDFISSLPSVVTDVSGAKSKQLRRLTYRLVPAADALECSIGQPYKVIIFETAALPLAEDDFEALPRVEESCHAGLQKQLDLLIPDRPMDVRFVASQMAVIKTPPVLSLYAEDIRASIDGPDASADAVPPLRFIYEGDEYYLHQSIDVRQSQDTVNTKPTISDYDSIMNDKPVAIHDLPIMKENRVDSESGLKTSACQITCDDHTMSGSWDEFLSRCDQLSTVVYSSPGSAIASHLSELDST